MAQFFQKSNYKAITLIIGLIAFSSLFVWYIFAFTEPTSTPPTCPAGSPGCDAPLNVGPSSQSKVGWLTIGGTAVPSYVADVQGDGTLRTTGGAILNTGGAPTGLIVDQGNVGIGTSSPSELLQLGNLWVFHNGGDKAQGFNAEWDEVAGTWRYLETNFAGAAIWYYGPAGWPFRLRVAPGGTAGAPIPTFNPGLTISGDGNMAIGTDFFGLGIGKLTVFKDQNPPFPSCCDDTGGIVLAGASNQNQRLQLGYDTTDDYAWIRAAHVGIGLRPLVLAPDGGNVGIGTTIPGAKLNVVGGNVIIERNDGTPVELSLLSNAWGAKILLDGGAGPWTIDAQSSSDFAIVDIDGDIPFEIQGSAPDKAIVLDAGGTLRINGDPITIGNNNQGIAIGRAVGGAPTPFTDQANIWVDDRGSVAGRASIHIQAEDGTRHVFGDLVGIGTVSPGFKLDVAGSAHASSFPVSSDIRFKTNVSPLSGTLEKLDMIRGVSFDWNELYESLGRSTGRREIGVIAQEIETVFPELVTTWGDESYKAVDYGRLTAVLVEAVKELKADNEVLKQRIEVLEGR